MMSATLPYLHSALLRFLVLLSTIGSTAATSRAQEIFPEKSRVAEQGVNFAKSANTNWRLVQHVDEMSGKSQIDAVSTQGITGGIQAEVRTTCSEDAIVVFEASLFDQRGSPLSSILNPEFLDKKLVAYSGRVRINDELSLGFFPTSRFPNTVQLAALTDPDTVIRNRFLTLSLALPGFSERFLLDRATTWQFMAEILVPQGAIVVKIPTFDRNIQQVITACRNKAP